MSERLAHAAPICHRAVLAVAFGERFAQEHRSVVDAKRSGTEGGRRLGTGAVQQRQSFQLGVEELHAEGIAAELGEDRKGPAEEDPTGVRPSIGEVEEPVRGPGGAEGGLTPRTG